MDDPRATVGTRDPSRRVTYDGSRWHVPRILAPALHVAHLAYLQGVVRHICHVLLRGQRHKLHPAAVAISMPCILPRRAHNKLVPLCGETSASQLFLTRP
jgi:hypothetical protein